MNKTLFIMLFVTLVSISGRAQEFWMHPDKFIYQTGENITVNFETGENFMGEAWNLQRGDISKLELLHFTTVRNLMALFTNEKKERLVIPINAGGTHIITLQTENALRQTEAGAFNAYLKDAGLDEIYALRMKNNSENETVNELRLLNVKLLVQVGNQRDDTYKKVDGFPIEIVPQRNPYSLKKGDPIRFRILYEGKPLFGVKVKVWNRYDHRTTLQNIYTEKDGTMETHISNSGMWMVSVVTMAPAKPEGAEWQSYQENLIFGIE